MVDMQEIIWEGCHPTISTAVQRVLESGRAFSTDLNAKRSILSLIKKFIDPAANIFRQELPDIFQDEFLSGNSAYSDLILKYGYDKSRKLLQDFERNFAKNSYEINHYQKILATLSTIYSFTWECELRSARNFPVRDKDGHEGGLNRSLDQVYCVVCGNSTAFAISLTKKHTRDEDDKIRPSYKFCPEHTPLLNEKCNSSYKMGMRQLKLLTRECYRLLSLSNLLGCFQFSGVFTLVDWYLFFYIEKHNLKGEQLPIIRRHAYEMVRDKISDRKKEIQTLRRFGHSQNEIANLTCSSRQSISKAICATPERYVV